MKRYFDIPKERLTMKIDVLKSGTDFTVEEIEKATKTTGLREIDLKEFNRLNKEYGIVKKKKRKIINIITKKTYYE